MGPYNGGGDGGGGGGGQTKEKMMKMLHSMAIDPIFYENSAELNPEFQLLLRYRLDPHHHHHRRHHQHQKIVVVDRQK